MNIVTDVDPAQKNIAQKTPRQGFKARSAKKARKNCRGCGESGTIIERKLEKFPAGVCIDCNSRGCYAKGTLEALKSALDDTIWH